MSDETPRVVAVASSERHSFSKTVRDQICLIEGMGVEGDAHCGKLMKHRSRVAVNPEQPNLRQVHLLPTELFDELARKGFAIEPARLGENITTTGIDLIGLPKGTRLTFSEGAEIEVTGLRNPCAQIEAFRKGLLAEVVGKGPTGAIERRAGIMAVVVRGGAVRAGDAVTVTLPPEPHIRMERV